MLVSKAQISYVHITEHKTVLSLRFSRKEVSWT